MMLLRLPRAAAPDPGGRPINRLGGASAAVVLALIILLPSCASASGSASVDEPPGAPLRILALGDSYTIGEGVAAAERWPVQLAAVLRARGTSVAEPTIIARTGWTTDELDAAISAADLSAPYDLVTLLIGVNNQYRGRELTEFEVHFATLLGRAIALAGGDPQRVIVLSIPDWGVTPFAEGRDRERIAREIDAFNAVNRDAARRSGARWVDVTPVSREARTDARLLAADRLHPSASMYAAWAELALSDALAAIGR